MYTEYKELSVLLSVYLQFCVSPIIYIYSPNYMFVLLLCVHSCLCPNGYGEGYLAEIKAFSALMLFLLSHLKLTGVPWSAELLV